MKTLKKCDLCESKNMIFLFSGKDMMYNIKGNYSVYQCNNCGLLFINPQPNTREIAKHYPKNEYYSLREKKRSWLREQKENIFYPINANIILKTVLHTIRPFIRTTKFIDGGNILDVGCGTGEFLRKMRKYNMNCYGVEPNEFDKNNARKHKIEIYNGNVIQANYPDNFFDVITLNHVIEHINNPTDTLKELNRILKPDGTLIITCPQIDSLAYKIFRKHWVHTDIPRHLYYYSTNTLKKYSKKTGFKIENITYKQRPFGFSGSILYWSNRFRKKQTYLSDRNFSNNMIISLIFMPIAYICNILKTGDEVEITLTK